MIFPLLTLIAICYGGIQFFELTALLGRISGIKMNAVLLGYSVQQTVYMITRFFVIAMLPLLGFIVDTGIRKLQYMATAHASLLFATMMGLLALSLSGRIVSYYSSVILKYSAGGSFFQAFFVRPSGKTRFIKPPLLNILRSDRARLILIQSNIVFLIYSTGIFLSFFFALVFHEYRTTISQLSGVINALGAVVLTLVIEPKISKSIDTREEQSIDLIFALFWGRVLATGITGQIALGLVFFAK